MNRWSVLLHRSAKPGGQLSAMTPVPFVPGPSRVLHFAMALLILSSAKSRSAQRPAPAQDRRQCLADAAPYAVVVGVSGCDGGVP